MVGAKPSKPVPQQRGYVYVTDDWHSQHVLDGGFDAPDETNSVVRQRRRRRPQVERKVLCWFARARGVSQQSALVGRSQGRRLSAFHLWLLLQGETQIGSTAK